jgi:hypothetical protein
MATGVRTTCGARRGPLVPAAAALLAAALPSSAAAATFTVDRVDDVVAPECIEGFPDDCSLRGAILAANLDTTADVIVVPDGLYELTLPGADEDSGFSGDLDVLAGVTLQAAPGAHPVIVQTVTDRLLHVSSTGAVQIVGPMTLAGGTAVSSSGSRDGGSILSDDGSLAIAGVVIAGGIAPDDGGCLRFLNQQGPGSLFLVDVEVRGCAAGRDGGGMHLSIGANPVTMTRVVVEGNQAGRSAGGMSLLGGLQNTVVSESIVRGNSAGAVAATTAGGGIVIGSAPVSLLRSTVAANQVGTAGSLSGEGGGLYIVSSPVLIQNSTVSGNRAFGTASATGNAMTLLTSNVGVEFSTIVGDPQAAFESIRVGNGTSLAFEASIVQASCLDPGSGTMTSSGLNAERPIDGSVATTCGLTHVSDVFTTQPLLRPLAGYGGPTPTHALLESALGVVPAVPADTCNDPVGGPIDQRGAPRTLLFCEPGSYEHGAEAPGPWIFSDGFESGDAGAWSAVVP